MAKRRDVIIGFGAAAAGGGMLLGSGAFNAQVDIDDTDTGFEIVVRRHLTVSEADESLPSSPSAVTTAGVQGNTDDENLEINIFPILDDATSFDNFLEVVNNGDESEDIGILLDDFSDSVVDDGTTSKLDPTDVANIFKFSHNDNTISAKATSDITSPLSLNSGDSTHIDLELNTNVGTEAGDTISEAQRDTIVGEATVPDDNNIFGSPGDAPVDGVEIFDKLTIGIDPN